MLVRRRWSTSRRNGPATLRWPRCELLEAGAAGAGYLLKDRVAEVERFIAAVRRVARGGTVLDPKVVAAMVRGRRGAFEALTGRERDVLMEMAAGRSNRGIAGALFVSERAVERHVTAISTSPAATARTAAVLAVLALLRA
jgi:DNA-binding NarL/FixJ family response regulator